jgi:hypothetical protein
MEWEGHYSIYRTATKTATTIDRGNNARIIDLSTRFTGARHSTLICHDCLAICLYIHTSIIIIIIINNSSNKQDGKIIPVLFRYQMGFLYIFFYPAYDSAVVWNVLMC